MLWYRIFRAKRLLKARWRKDFKNFKILAISGWNEVKWRQQSYNIMMFNWEILEAIHDKDIICIVYMLGCPPSQQLWQMKVYRDPLLKM